MLSLMRNRAVLMLSVLLVVAGCSRLAASSESVDGKDDSANTPVIWSDYEDFNAAGYAEEQPSLRPEIKHDAPPGLLSGREGGDGAFGEQSGFRIHIFSTLDPIEAERAAAEATAWWQELENEKLLDSVYPGYESEPPVYRDFRAPYYRVRIGNFELRPDAQRMLDLVEDRYPSAFIVPDRIIVQ